MKQARAARLLVVDDEPPILFAMREYFEALGYQVDCASELEPALQLLGRVAYDAVIADLRLTGVHGTEGLEIVSSARARQPRTRIVLLTAYGSPEIEAEARRRGADALLYKPKPLPEVAEVVAALLASTS